jgi:hypothetical protein
VGPVPTAQRHGVLHPLCDGMQAYTRGLLMCHMMWQGPQQPQYNQHTQGMK